LSQLQTLNEEIEEVKSTGSKEINEKSTSMPGIKWIEQNEIINSHEIKVEDRLNVHDE